VSIPGTGSRALATIEPSRETSREPARPAEPAARLQLFAGAADGAPGAARPYRRPGGDHRLTETGLSELVHRIEAVSTYMQEVETESRDRERLLDDLHVHMQVRLAEAEEQVRLADARARAEAARADAAEERIQVLEQWLLRITEAMSAVERTGG
jgi:hypothetical protein